MINLQSSENIIRTGKTEGDLICLKSKEIYAAYVFEKCDKSKARLDYTAKFDINDDLKKDIYLLPFRLKVSNKIKEMQYKVLHNYIAAYNILYRMGLSDSFRCHFCFLYKHTLSHLLFECTPVRNFWFLLESALNYM